MTCVSTAAHWARIPFSASAQGEAVCSSGENGGAASGVGRAARFAKAPYERLLRHLIGYPAVAAVLAAHFLVAVASVREKSNTHDEIAHVTAGFSYWTKNDYRLHSENGNLPQRWFALPLLTMGLKFPEDQAPWTAADVWRIGQRFFFDVGNDLETLLWRARCMNAILSVGLGLLVYAWSRRLFGPIGGMLSLLVYATDPTVLANGSLATSDLAAAAFFTLAVGCLWTMFHTVSPGSIVCTWLALAGLLLCKMSALLIVPMGVALLILRLIGHRPLKVVGGGREKMLLRWPVQLGILCGAILLQMALVAGTIWAFYGFRYSALREPLTGNERRDVKWNKALADTGVFGEAVNFARDNRLLPEAYLFGTAFAYKHAQQRDAFLNGQYSKTGWWYFFPYTFLVKTPLATFVVLILAGAGSAWTWRRTPGGQGCATRAAVWQAFYATAPLWILLAIYWATAIHGKLNIGHRHLLPTYPAMFILLGAAGYWFEQRGRLGWLGSSAVLACTLVLAADCYAMYPHYLAYFNRIAGGPGNGYKHLVDSSLDWGQDLPGLKRWLKKNDLDGQTETPVYLFYPGTSSPLYYGIHATEIWNSRAKFLVPWKAGVYCISATDLQGQYHGGPWTAAWETEYRELGRRLYVLKTASASQRDRLIESRGREFWKELCRSLDSLRNSRLCAFLRQREPYDSVGHSILIYRLTAEDIRDALLGPPVWLDATLGPVEDYGQLGQLDQLAAPGHDTPSRCGVLEDSQQQTEP